MNRATHTKVHPMPIFSLRLQPTYFQKGFFNVIADFDRFVRSNEGPIGIQLGPGGLLITGKLSRSANMNGTARIYGGSPLRDWFQHNFGVMDLVGVDLTRPDLIVVGVPAGSRDSARAPLQGRAPSSDATAGVAPGQGASPGEQVDRPHQRVGAISNAHVGRDFEAVALEYFASQGIQLQRNYPVELGLNRKKVHNFDLGASAPMVLVECKSHRWTAGGAVPSAKMTVWNEAMYYFHLAPAGFRKILFVLHDRRDHAGESLLAYYHRTYTHLIPEDVEFIEWDEATGTAVRM